jgi:site-specific DNA-adenine methylase
MTSLVVFISAIRLCCPKNVVLGVEPLIGGGAICLALDAQRHGTPPLGLSPFPESISR